MTKLVKLALRKIAMDIDPEVTKKFDDLANMPGNGPFEKMTVRSQQALYNGLVNNLVRKPENELDKWENLADLSPIFKPAVNVYKYFKNPDRGLWYSLFGDDEVRVNRDKLLEYAKKNPNAPILKQLTPFGTRFK